MASLTSYDSQVYKTPGVKFIVGAFQINGTSAPDVLIGKGWTVARSDVGKFTVTLSETFPRCVSVVATAGETADDGDHGCHVGEIDRTTTFSSFVVYFRTAGSDAEPDNGQVNFICVVADTTIETERSS